MPEFLVIHIPGNVEPLERGDRFEDPLDRALKAAGKLGKCVGGGTAFETEPEFRVTGCNIEVEVKDLAKALPVIRDTFTTAQAPPGTTVTHPDTEKVLLRFTKSGVKESAPSKKPAPKRFVDSCPWEPGEVLAYRITRDRYVLLHVYGSGFASGAPVFWIPEWCGPEIPDSKEIHRLMRKKPEFYRFGFAYEAWRAKETDRNEGRIIRTGIVIPPPPNDKLSWSPGLVQVRPWKVFERMLKEFFGLVAVSPAVRLAHDLNLKKKACHLAVWHPNAPASKEDAKRQFYAQICHFRPKRPNRDAYPISEELKAFVAELKAEFASDDVWKSNFDAKERFVTISVKRKKFAAVWAMATRLARRHGLACYDPQAEKVCQGQA